MTTKSTIAMTLAMGVALSGCQAIFGSRTANLESADRASLAQQEAAVNPALDQGRQLLKAGRIAQAVELLRVAQRDPDSMADASNALGVAYAKLGRHDLADRYFRMALALEPGDARFASNMLRLQRDHNLALRRAAEEEQLALRAREEQERREIASREAEEGRIQRVSRGQVQIRTGGATPVSAPRMEVLALNSSKPEPEVETVEGAEEAAKPKSYPVTIDFSNAARKASASDKQYPVRVYIGG